MLALAARPLAALAALLSLAATASPALAQSAPDPLGTRNLTVVARTYGDSAGRISLPDANGKPELLARARPTPVPYRAGQTVFVNDVFLTCVENVAGGLSSCDPLDLSSGGGASEYHCESDCDGSGCDGWCQCSGALDCIGMVLSGNCTGGLDCSGGECFCPNW